MQQQYIDYLEKTLYKGISDIPNFDKIKNFVNNDVDLSAYYIYDKWGTSRYNSNVPGQTLLYGLVRIIPIFSGTKPRLNKITEIMEYILNHGANVDEGFTKISPRSRKPKGSVVTPLTNAINNRIVSAIRILIDYGATIYEFHKDKWLTYIKDARTTNERDKLIEIMKLLQPGYVYRPDDDFEERNVAHNAQNVISLEDIQDGDLMVNINDEMYGSQGKLGSHSHYYKKTSWDNWERSKKQSGETVTSPYTRQSIRSKVTYKAKILPNPEATVKAETVEVKANNGTTTSTNTVTTTTTNANGGKRRGHKKTRKLKRKGAH